jgi:hypothetical protein
MKRPSFPNKCESIAVLPTGLWFSRFGCGFLAIVVATALSGLSVEQLFAAESATSGTSIEQRILELTPKLEDYVATGIKAFERSLWTAASFIGTIELSISIPIFN